MKMTIAGMRKRDCFAIILEIVSVCMITTSIVVLPFAVNGLI